jgi:hypothetical protein
VRVALLLAAAVILVRDPTGKWANDPLRPWFEALKNKDGMVCCAEVIRSTRVNGTSRAIAIASSSKAIGLLCLTVP